MDKQTKRCTVCGIHKDLTEFHKQKKGKFGVDSRCKVCFYAITTKYRQENKEKYSAFSRKYVEKNREKVRQRKKVYREKNRDKVRKSANDWRARNREKSHSYDILHKYNITKEQYNEMLEQQGGRCAANGCKEVAKHGRLSVDHCHATGIVRGLLCSRCNTALGRVDDSIEKLRGLISYLEGSRQ